MTTTPTAHPFAWYELMTTDTTDARRFYGAVFGWGFDDMPGSDPVYTALKVGAVGIGGMMAQPAEVRAAGAPPAWLGYIHVPDVDAAVAKLQAAGGSLHKPPTDVPGAVRFAVVADPQCALFYLFHPLSPGPETHPAPGAQGTVGWRELLAADGETALPFYAEQFGWRQTGAVDMGAMGSYRLFATGGDEAVGGIMTKPAFLPAPFWNFYFRVDALDGATERVKANGGQIVNGPHQVPGDTWIAQAVDPQGATFGMMSKFR